jgi:oligoendopeptidase F
MIETQLPEASAALDWSWAEIEPHYAALQARGLTAETVMAWLHDWSRLSELVSEVAARLHLTYDLNTADAESEQRYFGFLENVSPRVQAAENALTKKLLESGLEPEGLDVPLRNMRAEVALFREANLPLFTEHRKVATQYDKIVGAQTVEWEGQERPLPQMLPVFENADRATRERAWWRVRERQLADRDALNAVWRELLPLRRQIAANADCADYREFIWQAYQRFDYTPADCETFHAAIESVVVPAVSRLYERHRRRLGLEALRPWDLINGEWQRPATPPGAAPLRPYQDATELMARSAEVLNHVDPTLGSYFETMRREGLLDLENRKGKAPGGYCTHFAQARRPFIFMNAVGLHTDVQTLLHEAGHAFHAFESFRLPLAQQKNTPMEFNEVASMAMELLAAPYLSSEHGGFYSEAEAARARVEHLEGMLLFWPYMAVVDAFQHWVYTHLDEAQDTDACDATWRDLWLRFMPGVDWSGLEAELVTGWHRKLHIFRVPLYYVEYGLAQLGAAQVWRNALRDQAGAVSAYRRALALGGTATVPALYDAAGARFAFDAETLGQAVALIEKTIGELEAA